MTDASKPTWYRKAWQSPGFRGVPARGVVSEG